jgi:hypothetical protein
MSTLKTLSSFFWGTLINSTNFAIDFDEGAFELNASIPLGDNTLTEFVAAIQSAMRLTGALVYTATLNRVTRKITISAPTPFTLRTNTGSRLVNSIWNIAGFNTAFNHTGSNSYTGEFECGLEYITQIILGDYTSVEHSSVKENSTVSTTARGITQIVHFGKGSRPKMNLRGITNKTGLRMPLFYENANGIQNALDFMEYLIDKNKVEFMPDKDNRAVFKKLFLEGSSDSRDGTQFELKNIAVDWYETGTLTFREVLT